MEVSQEDKDLPDAATVMPRAHFEALRIEVPLVIGARGTGKSFWHNILTNPGKLAFVRAAYPEIKLPVGIGMLSAFSARQEGNKGQPPKDFLLSLGNSPAAWRTLWQSIIAAKLFPERLFKSRDSWKTRTDKIRGDIENFNAELRSVDLDRAKSKRPLLLVFDALDTISDEWELTVLAIRELLKLVTDYRLLSALRFKVFLRADIAQDSNVSSFPDASKLFANRAELIWEKEDLFTLLFQRLVNASDGDIFIRLANTINAGTFKEVPAREPPSWILERAYRTDSDLHRRLFEHLAGKAMGGGASGTKRGIPFSWIYNHLLDARGAVSPRSFCVALHEAASETRPGQGPTPLSPKDLEEGVRKASSDRVNELREEYPWIDPAMKALQRSGARVPCEKEAMIQAWEAEGTIPSILKNYKSRQGLPGTVRKGEYRAFLQALEQIGIISRMPDDDRYQVPDVYRVAFGLGRKGGIPVKRH
jgi:hypothetical protein